MVGPMCMQCEAKIDPLLLNPQRSTTDARVRCVCCGKLHFTDRIFCKMVGPMCMQCEAKIDPLLLNPQRSTTDARVRCVCCGKLQ
ncbi:hypothetical protein PInf_017876 [Phytophthora infestans]|nr:hypothetical protein PInf_017876 [Phytophthora infestans]